ncbi:MAG: DUF5329 domain-containing protein [Aureispira sp.]|nr:DUF5329 domain-containing protein [Aureispira sp.]
MNYKTLTTKGTIKTLDQFIENIASKSSISGKPYQVKLDDGTIVNTTDWYKTLEY